MTTTPAAPTSNDSPQDENSVEARLARMCALPEDSTERRRLRDDVIAEQLPLVHKLTRRFLGRGEQYDDLFQVATVGLIKAVDNYDPAREVRLTSYAVPTIVGELKRHFRDKGWDVRIPRRLQELVLDVRSAADTLSQRDGRSPTPRQLARHLDVSEDQVIEALTAWEHYSSLSLDAPVAADEDRVTLADTLSDPGDMSEAVENSEALMPLVEQLPERERFILLQTFYGNKSQSAIAAMLGISQMHVSRLLARALRRLREQMLDVPPAQRTVPRASGHAPREIAHRGNASARTHVHRPRRSRASARKQPA